MSVNILYAKQTEDYSGDILNEGLLKDFFADAADLLIRIKDSGRKTGYFFIDPLLDTFEAGNKFYINILGLGSIPKVSFFRSGAGPAHAYADARLMIEKGIFDAVAVFAYEPLQHNKKYRGKEAVSQAMKILDVNLVHCYNDLMQRLMEELSIDEEQYKELTDKLYENYSGSYTELHPEHPVKEDRGAYLTEMGGPLFRLTDCANPNIDYAGGVILTNDEVFDTFRKQDQKRVSVLAAAHHMVSADWEHPEKITGTKSAVFPHLKKCFEDIEEQAGNRMTDLLQAGKTVLNAYTCYPPIPLAFLLSGGFASTSEEIISFLDKYRLTLDGGLSLGRSPWNCPALRSSILAADRIMSGEADYGLVQGNGGIGETQGLVLLGKTR